MAGRRVDADMEWPQYDETVRVTQVQREELRFAKKELEARIALAIEPLVREFQHATGLEVSSVEITVDNVKKETMGGDIEILGVARCNTYIKRII